MTDDNFLIISQSARALAKSAFESGICVNTIDSYMDLDTCHYAKNTACIDNDAFTDYRQLASLVVKLTTKNRNTKIIIGSGFEHVPQWLEKLQKYGRVYSNNSHLIKWFSDPKKFFPLLDKLNIPYPKINFDGAKKLTTEKWLYKKIAGQGGRGIGYLSQFLNKKNDYYFQKWIPGKSLSALFLAYQKRVSIIGINEHLPHYQIPNHAFLYSGAITGTKLSPDKKKWLYNILKKIVGETGLIGLCGVDFIQDKKGRFFILEINPRPPATLALYPDIPCFSLHLNACSEGEITWSGKIKQHYGHQIIYAKKSTIIAKMKWPNWVTDIPRPEKHIYQYQPICSINAHASKQTTIIKMLQTRYNWLAQRLPIA